MHSFILKNKNKEASYFLLQHHYTMELWYFYPSIFCIIAFKKEEMKNFTFTQFSVLLKVGGI